MKEVSLCSGVIEPSPVAKTVLVSPVWICLTAYSKSNPVRSSGAKVFLERRNSPTAISTAMCSSPSGTSFSWFHSWLCCVLSQRKRSRQIHHLPWPHNRMISTVLLLYQYQTLQPPFQIRNYPREMIRAIGTALCSIALVSDATSDQFLPVFNSALVGEFVACDALV